jgi:TIR domain
MGPRGRGCFDQLLAHDRDSLPRLCQFHERHGRSVFRPGGIENCYPSYPSRFRDSSSLAPCAADGFQTRLCAWPPGLRTGQSTSAISEVLGPGQSTQPAKGYVFLSYVEEDADFLAKLRGFFGERGYAYWEFESSDRDYQKRIDLELEGVISSAVATVSVLSEAWKASTWSCVNCFSRKRSESPSFFSKRNHFP